MRLKNLFDRLSDAKRRLTLTKSVALALFRVGQRSFGVGNVCLSTKTGSVCRSVKKTCKSPERKTPTLPILRHGPEMNSNAAAVQRKFDKENEVVRTSILVPSCPKCISLNLSWLGTLLWARQGKYIFPNVLTFKVKFAESQREPQPSFGRRLGSCFDTKQLEKCAKHNEFEHDWKQETQRSQVFWTAPRWVCG